LICFFVEVFEDVEFVVDLGVVGDEDEWMFDFV